MIRYIFFAFAVGLLIGFVILGQSDPVPDSLKLEVVTAHRDYLQADKDYQDAMRKLNEVETRRAGLLRVRRAPRPHRQSASQVCH